MVYTTTVILPIMPFVEPLYVEHHDLGNTVGSNIQLELCEVCDKHVPGQVICIQIVRGGSIWLKTAHARAHMINKIKNIEVNNNIVELCDNYPTSKPVPNEKIMFRDIPFSVKDSAILQYLEKQKGITVKTGVIHSRIRDQQNKLTRFCSRERTVFSRA